MKVFLASYFCPIKTVFISSFLFPPDGCAIGLENGICMFYVENRSKVESDANLKSKSNCSR